MCVLAYEPMRLLTRLRVRVGTQKVSPYEQDRSMQEFKSEGIVHFPRNKGVFSFQFSRERGE